MCTLKVRGEDPRIAAFARESGLRLEVVVEDGVRTSYPSGKQYRRTQDKPGVFAFNAYVSGRAWSDLEGQFTDAVEFVSRHREQLAKLRELKCEWAVLDFPAEVDPEGLHVVLFDFTIPVELARASSEVGLAVEVTLYFAAKEQSQVEPPASTTPDAEPDGSGSKDP